MESHSFRHVSRIYKNDVGAYSITHPPKTPKPTPKSAPSNTTKKSIKTSQGVGKNTSKNRKVKSSLNNKNNKKKDKKKNEKTSNKTANKTSKPILKKSKSSINKVSDSKQKKRTLFLKDKVIDMIIDLACNCNDE